MLGGVYFFGVDPVATETEKHITVNLDGVDYYPCTVKIHSKGKRPNGSWRIQLRGISSVTGDTLEHVVGHDYFKNKILVFELIRSDYFVMSVFDESELESFKSASIVVARMVLGSFEILRSALEEPLRIRCDEPHTPMQSTPFERGNRSRSSAVLHLKGKRYLLHRIRA